MPGFSSRSGTPTPTGRPARRGERRASPQNSVRIDSPCRPTEGMDELYVVRQLPTWHEEPEPDDEYDNGTDHKTLYALFGLAIYKANVLEHSLVNVLAITKIVSAREQGERLILDPWAQGFKEMMGKLIKRVAAHTSAYPEVGNDLTNSLKRRNFLVHNFWRERVPETIAEAGRAKLCADLKADCRLFAQTDERFSERVLRPMMESLGITAEDMEAEYLKERREAMARYGTGRSRPGKIRPDQHALFGVLAPNWPLSRQPRTLRSMHPEPRHRVRVQEPGR